MRFKQGAPHHMSLVVRQKCLTVQDQIGTRKNSSVRRRTGENEALCVSLSPVVFFCFVVHVVQEHYYLCVSLFHPVFLYFIVYFVSIKEIVEIKLNET